MARHIAGAGKLVVRPQVAATQYSEAFMKLQ